MKIGFIGIGKMGGQMVARLVKDGHSVTVLDLDKSAVDATVAIGAKAATNRAELIKVVEPLVLWLMIPSQFVDQELAALLEVVPENSIIIDGGNSDFRLTMQRAQLLAAKNVEYVDVGTSGGVLGLEKGFSMMVGGSDTAIKTITPLLDSLTMKDGWKHFGPTGYGHYIKMIHNGIEYGLMQSYAEGYHLLKEGPLKNIDLAGVGEVWQHGSIIGSLLNECATGALFENPELEGIDGFVAESGEARWTLEIAEAARIETPSIQTALDVRVASQQGKKNFATKLLAAMRNKFGGHAINELH